MTGNGSSYYAAIIQDGEVLRATPLHPIPADASEYRSVQVDSNLATSAPIQPAQQGSAASEYPSMPVTTTVLVSDQFDDGPVQTNIL